MIKPALLKQIFAHVEEEAPREACGLIVHNKIEKYMPCRNLSAVQDEFLMHPLDQADIEDAGYEILRVVHSHVNGPPKPSDADVRGCQETGVPWTIVSWPLRLVQHINPDECSLPLIGRVFTHGLVDCYTLVQDWIFATHNIKMNWYARKDNWWKNGENLYLDNLEKEQLYKLPQERLDHPQEGDFILMNIESDVPNHMAIYVGDGKILHHCAQRLSRHDMYGGYWRKHAWCVVRHWELMTNADKEATRR